MDNYRGVVSYNGWTLSGWQRQKNTKETIQEYLESAIEAISGEKVHVIGAGRTDAGVHAFGQVFNFQLAGEWEPRKLIRAINGNIHTNIALLSLEVASPSFNALRDAQEKWYRYRILNRNVRCPFRRGFVYFCPMRLDIEKMITAAGYLQGRYDFTSFCATRSTAQTRIRTLETLNIRRVDDEIQMDFRAKGFLYKMIRNIVGTLVWVGKGRLEPADIQKILDGRDRSLAGPTAPPYGLTLMEVKY